jgi:CheY-like chemotaxis protein
VDTTAKSCSTVLLIDDNADLILTVKMYLSLQGHTVHCAETARDGLELLARTDPDVVFSDIDLPDRDGFELAALIRNNPDWRNIPLIAVTARPDLLLESKTSPFDRILLKPVRLEAMLTIVESFPSNYIRGFAAGL